MSGTKDILGRIKESVSNTAPNATIILYGSRARGDSAKESDFDILILINKDSVSYEDEIKIKYPLYDIEFDTGEIISPLIISKSDWEQKHKITPFFENVTREGIVL